MNLREMIEQAPPATEPLTTAAFDAMWAEIEAMAEREAEMLVPLDVREDGAIVLTEEQARRYREQGYVDVIYNGKHHRVYSQATLERLKEIANGQGRDPAGTDEADPAAPGRDADD